MVIATTIEQEQQRNELWTAVMGQLKDRAARKIHVNAKGQTFEHSIWKFTDEQRHKMRNKPHFTCDVSQGSFRYRIAIKNGENQCSGFRYERQTNSIIHTSRRYTGEGTGYSHNLAHDIEGYRSQRWLSFDLRNVKWGRSATGTTNLKHSQLHGNKYSVKDLKEMCAMNAIKVPAAAKYLDIVNLLKTLP
jgi:hypothetical protein